MICVLDGPSWLLCRKLASEFHGGFTECSEAGSCSGLGKNNNGDKVQCGGR